MNSFPITGRLAEQVPLSTMTCTLRAQVIAVNQPKYGSQLLPGPVCDHPFHTVIFLRPEYTVSLHNLRKRRTVRDQEIRPELSFSISDRSLGQLTASTPPVLNIKFLQYMDGSGSI